MSSIVHSNDATSHDNNVKVQEIPSSLQQNVCEILLAVWPDSGQCDYSYQNGSGKTVSECIRK